MTQLRIVVALTLGMITAALLPPAAAVVLVPEEPPWPTCSGLTCPGGICAYVFETPDCPPAYALVTPVEFIRFADQVKVLRDQLCIFSCGDDWPLYFNMQNPGAGCSVLAPYDFYRPSKDPATGKTRRACVDPVAEWCMFVEAPELNPHDPCCWDESMAWFCWDCFEECD